MKFKPDLQSFKLAFKPLVLTILSSPSIQNGDERVVTWRKIGSKRSSKREFGDQLIFETDWL